MRDLWFSGQEKGKGVGAIGHELKFKQRRKEGGEFRRLVLFENRTSRLAEWLKRVSRRIPPWPEKILGPQPRKGSQNCGRGLQ